MSETIERAAVLKDGKVYDVPRPGRHHTALRLVCESLALDFIGEHEQGFVTSTGRFVGREEAWALANAAGQVKPREWGPALLFSEDVW